MRGGPKLVTAVVSLLLLVFIASTAAGCGGENGKVLWVDNVKNESTRVQCRLDDPVVVELDTAASVDESVIGALFSEVGMWMVDNRVIRMAKVPVEVVDQGKTYSGEVSLEVDLWCWPSENKLEGDSGSWKINYELEVQENGTVAEEEYEVHTEGVMSGTADFTANPKTVTVVYSNDTDTYTVEYTVSELEITESSK